MKKKKNRKKLRNILFSKNKTTNFNGKSKQK